jgi:hypothetical protein
MAVKPDLISGMFSFFSGQWSVVSGQWSVVSGQADYTRVMALCQLFFQYLLFFLTTDHWALAFSDH